jgi:hypothetical protein
MGTLMSTASRPDGGGPHRPFSLDLGLGILAAAVATIAAAFCLLASPSFFLTDDNIGYFSPGLSSIQNKRKSNPPAGARSLRSGAEESSEGSGCVVDAVIGDYLPRLS